MGSSLKEKWVTSYLSWRWTLMGKCPAQPRPDTLYRLPPCRVTHTVSWWGCEHMCTPTETCRCTKPDWATLAPPTGSGEWKPEACCCFSPWLCQVSHRSTCARTCTYTRLSTPHVDCSTYVLPFLFLFSRFLFFSFLFFFGYSLPFFNCYNLYQHIMLNNYRERSSL